MSEQETLAGEEIIVKTKPVTGDITTYVSGYEIQSATVAGFVDVAHVHPNWTTIAAQTPVTTIAVAVGELAFWMATPGGVTHLSRAQGLSTARYASEHGLPGNHAQAICIDSQGVVWAATRENGLAWFSGQGWHLYDHPLPGPPGHVASSTHLLCNAGLAGGVWAVTADGVYRILDPHQGPQPIALRPQDGAVDALTLLADGDSLLLGNAWGLFRLGVDGQVEQIAEQALTECSALTRDNKERVWAAGPDGIYQLVDDHALRRSLLPTKGRILALAGGRSRLWALTHDGIAYWEDDGEWQIVPSDEAIGRIWAIAGSIDDAYLWLGSENGFGYLRVPVRFDSIATDKPKAAPLWRRSVMELHPHDRFPLGRCNILAGPDDLGRLWVGTGDGVVLIEGEHVQQLQGWHVDVKDIHYQESYKRIWMLAYPNGILLGDNFDVSGSATGLAHIETIGNFPGLATQIAVGGDEQAYCITGQGLWRLDKKGWRLAVVGLPSRPDPLFPTALVQTGDGVWWMGAEYGLFFHRNALWHCVHEEEEHAQVRGVRALIKMGNDLWVGCASGLWFYTQGVWEEHTLLSEDFSGAVSALAWAAGGVWVAAHDGVILYDPTERQVVHHWTPRNSGLGSSAVNSLLETDGHLWVATDVGISRITL